MNSTCRQIILIVFCGCLVLAETTNSRAQGLPDSTFYVGSMFRSFAQPVEPEQYLIRPGEKLEVVFLDSKLPVKHLIVNYEGRVVTPDLGVINLSGKTLAQARNLLLEPLRRLYNAKEIVITIGSIYPVAIQVTGRVNRPGTYTGLTSQRVSEIIDSAGGVAPGGSKRRITFQGGPKNITADLALAVATGDLTLDPCLYAGRRIIVGEMADAPVVVWGAVVHPGPVELLKGEGLERLIALAGGPVLGAAKQSSVVVNDRERDIHEPGGILPGDKIFVPSSLVASESGEVIVTGAAKRTGRRIALSKAGSLSALINSLGGLEPYADQQRIAVFRLVRDPVYEFQTGERFPLMIAQNGGEVLLEPGDSIHIPRRLEHVEIQGEIARPGIYPYAEGKKVGDYITMAGGLVKTTAGVTIEVFDRVSGITHVGSERSKVYDGDRIIIKSVGEER